MNIVADRVLEICRKPAAHAVSSAPHRAPWPMQVGLSGRHAWAEPGAWRRRFSYADENTAPTGVVAKGRFISDSITYPLPEDAAADHQAFAVSPRRRNLKQRAARDQHQPQIGSREDEPATTPFGPERSKEEGRDRADLRSRGNPRGLASALSRAPHLYSACFRFEMISDAPSHELADVGARPPKTRWP